MTARPMCPLCKAEGKTWVLCKVCTDKLRENLRELPGLMRDIQDKRIGRTVMPAPANMVGNPDEAPVPYSDHGRRTADLIVNTVGSWVRVLDQDDLIEPGFTEPTICTCRSPRRQCELQWEPLRPRMASWCRWLADRIDRIRFHEAAGQIADEIGGCCSRARKAIDLPPELMLVQKCPTCGHGIFAGKDEETVVCVHCRRAGVDPLPTINVAEARGNLDGMVEHQWATAAKCALVLAAYGMPVKADTIQNWARPERGGRLKVRGVDHAQRRLYRVGDVADLVRAATRRATSDTAPVLDGVTECNA